MPDFKLWDTEHCRKYLVASDYAEAARNVIAAMHTQAGELTVDENGLALRGVLVRHLVMPGLLDDTREIMIMRGKQTARFDLVVEELGHAPRDREPVERGGAAANLIKND